MKRDVVPWKDGAVVILPALCYVAAGSILKRLCGLLVPEIDPIWNAIILAALTVVVYSKFGPKQETRRCFRGAWALWLLTALAVGLCLCLFPSLRQQEPATLLSLLGYGVAAPIAEELVYRGLVFRRAREKLGLFPALVISAALFAAAHVQPERMLVSLIFGFLLGLLYDRYRTVWAPILMHGTVNLLSFVLPRELPGFIGMIGGAILSGIIVFLICSRSVKK